MAIVIVGVGVLASAQLLAVGTQANGDAHRLTTALNLAANVRELAQQKTGAQVLAMNGQTYSPARDARNEPIANMSDWQQLVSVARVTQGEITLPAGATSTSRLLRLTVTVRFRGANLTTESWLVADTAE